VPCYHPQKVYKAKKPNPSTGKHSITWNPREALALDEYLTIKCGNCMDCRLGRSRSWAIRLMHEASLYQANCFITLTYSPEHLPLDESLDVTHFQLFMKRLRKDFEPKRIRFYHCGEYGERLKRPHYHACIFNHDFHDKKFHSQNSRGDKLYTSETLTRLWGLGHALLGELTFESAAYVARYVTKKINGRDALFHYETTNPITWEVTQKKPEYATMSRRPGIGAPWLAKYQKEVFNNDFIFIRGKCLPVPKFYDNVLEAKHPFDYEDLKYRREVNSEKNRANATPERLATREKIHQLKTKILKRNYEHET